MPEEYDKGFEDGRRYISGKVREAYDALLEGDIYTAIGNLGELLDDEEDIE